jgi:uncharacterized membrane protein YtjA (UPF0391 family)
MFNWPFLFVVISVVAALYGFMARAKESTKIARIVSVVFWALFVASLVYQYSQYGTTTSQNLNAKDMFPNEE